MADVTIAREAVQAGLDAFTREFAFGATPEMVEAILKGAAPLIVADELDRLAPWMRPDDEPLIRQRANALRAQS